MSEDQKSAGLDVSDYIKKTPNAHPNRSSAFQPDTVAPSAVEEDESGRSAFMDQISSWLNRPREGIHVSDLTFLKQAYFKQKHPEIKPTEREVGNFLAGRGHHGIIQWITTLASHREVEVSFNGVSGHIDWVHDVPWELKTTRAQKVRSAEELERRQPHYFEQLGFYAAMIGSNDAKLILFYLNANISKDKRAPLIKVYDVHYDDLDAIKREITRRKRALLKTLEEDDPSLLPDCPRWMCSNCRYRELCKGGRGQ